MAGSDFDVTLWVTLFLFSIWLGGRVFSFLKLPPILGYMVIGIIFGPNLLDVVPYASTGLCDSVVNPQPDGVDGSGSASGSARMLAEGGRMLAGGADNCQYIQWERWKSGYFVKSIWRFLGETGVTLMIFESGMHIHFDKVAQVGAKAFVVAIFGTLLPLAIGMATVGALFDGEYYPSGFAAGCSFAPTSVGIAIFLLEESKMLNTMAGQTIITSAFIDDVFSLITLVVMQNLAISPTIGAREIVVPIVGSVVILGGSVFFAVKVFDKLDHGLFDKMPTSKYASIAPRDELHLLIMVASLAGLGALAWWPDFVGSHLLGAFGAGMLFVNVPRSQALWQSQFKRIVRWLVRIFFAATVGFSVPIQQMMTGKAFGYGMILGVGPVIGAKIISGLFAPAKYSSEKVRRQARKASWATRCVQPQQLLVGMAMVARGEFAYLVAESAQTLPFQGDTSRKMMTAEVYASVMWALVCATIFSPVSFRWALAVYERAFPMERAVTITGDPRLGHDTATADHVGGDLQLPAAAIGNADAAEVRLSFHGKPSMVAGGHARHKSDWHQNDDLSHSFGLRIAARFHWGIHREIVACLYHLGVYVIEARILPIDDPNTKKIDYFVSTYHVIARGKKLDFDEEKLEEMHHELLQTIRDEEAQVIFEPKVPEFSITAIIEIRLKSVTDDIVVRIKSKLTEAGLVVIASIAAETEEGEEGAPDAAIQVAPNASPKRRLSLGHSSEMVAMAGVKHAPHAHAFYVRDAIGMPHFSEHKRQATIRMLEDELIKMSVIKEEERITDREDRGKSPGHQRKNSSAHGAGSKNGSAHGAGELAEGSVSRRGARKSASGHGHAHDQHHAAHKAYSASDGFVSLRVLHESEAPKEVIDVLDADPTF